MIKYYFRTIKDETIKVIEDPRTGVWVHVEDPTDEDLASLIKTFVLDADIVSDAKDFYEILIMELGSRGGAALFTRYPLRDQTQDNATAPILIIVGESFVITIAVREVPHFKKLISGEVEVFTTQKAKFFIQIMSIFTKSFDQELVRLRKAVHKDRVRLRSIGPREIERLVGYETTLNSMVDALIPTNTWLQQVTAGNFMQLYSDDVDTMEDLVIANGQVVNSARSILKMIQNIRGASEAIMTSRLNNALRILTVLTILMTVPLVIASLYGMNVELPFQHSPLVFPGIVLLNVMILGVLTWVFKKNDWF
ncbi:MAG: magnesium transporter CorA family protein [Candidatus Paceibacterota bacterium]